MSRCQLTPDSKSHLDLEYRREVTFGAPCPVVRHGCTPVIQYLTEGEVEDALSLRPVWAMAVPFL